MAGLVPQHVLEQIRHASDIVDVVGGYVPLKRAGANFQALCPFHKEKSPSFNVNPSKQIYHCFGCGKGGDVFRFVQDYESIPFMDAVRRLAERAKIPLEFENNPAAQQARAVKDQLLQIHEQITQRWQAALGQDGGQIARDYIAKRQISKEAVDLFRIGYAPDAWDDTVNWGKSKGFSPELLEQSGLVVRKEGSDRPYDRFRGRLMFPICDEQGRVIGFSGRILTGDEKTAKYVNSPETPLFTKGRVIFGLDKSKRAILDAKTAIVCEGQLDLIACFMAGVKNVVAPQGTAFTPDQARILKRYADEVVLCFDGDNAGKKATEKALETLAASQVYAKTFFHNRDGVITVSTASESAVRVAVVPPPDDPDSFLRKFGPDKFREIVDKAPSVFDFVLNSLCSDNDPFSDQGRLRIIRGMVEVLARADSDTTVEKYVQKTSIRLGTSYEATRADFRRTKQSLDSKEEPADGDHSDEISTGHELLKAPPSEELLLRLLLEHDELVPRVEPVLQLEWVSHDLARAAIEHRLNSARDESWRGVAAWIGELEDGPLLRLLTETLALPVPAGDPASILFGTANKPGLLPMLRDKFVDLQITAINQRLRDPELSDEDAIHLTQHKLELRKMKGRPLGQS